MDYYCGTLKLKKVLWDLSAWDKPAQQKPAETPKSGVTMLKPGTWNVRNAPSLGASVNRVVKGVQSVTYVDIIPESDPGRYGERDFYKLRDGTYLSVKACE